MFIHSLIFTIWIIWYAQYIVSEETVERITDMVQDTFSLGWWWIVLLIIAWIILAIGYWILPPIWEAAMLIYKHEWRKQWTNSLSKWFGKFFPMFEFHAATGLFQIHVILFALFRMYGLGILNNWLIITLMILRIVLSLFVSIFFSYSKMYIVLEWEKFFEAMKKSASLAMHNIWITVQFSVLTFLLWVRFIINILVLVGIPLLIIYLWTRLWLDSFLLLKIAFVILMLWLILLVSYVEWIIEAFFITCRWKVRHKVKDEDGSIKEWPAPIVDDTPQPVKNHVENTIRHWAPTPSEQIQQPTQTPQEISS